MKKHIKLLLMGMLMASAAMTLAGCASKEEKEAAAKFRTEADKYAEGNNYKAAQKSMKKALEQTPKDKELQAASDKLAAKAKKMEAYVKVMEDAITAIEAQDDEGLNALQESKEGKALAEMIGEEGSFIYMPKGGKTGKGIGYYSFKGCDCNQWYYGDYKEGIREGNALWYYVNPNIEEGKLYKEVYTGEWSQDKPNGPGHQYISSGEAVTEKDFTAKDGLFDGTYEIKDTLEDGTEVTGTYTLVNGKYQVIPDEELVANNFAVPDKPHLAIAFLYDESGTIRSCTMIYAKDVTEGAAHFR